MGDVFCKKVENGDVFFVKKVGNGGVFFCKKWTFPQHREHYVQYQYFLFYILFIWGCICTQRTPSPCLRAWPTSPEQRTCHDGVQ